MTVAELGALVRGLAPAVREYVASTQKRLTDRIEALETQDLIPGERGQAGEKGKDGAPGPSGRDGTLEQLKVAYDGERTMTLCFKNGDPIEGGVIQMPIVLDRGVYRPEVSYVKGDGVTSGGSFWIAQQDTQARPGDTSAESRAWRLAIKAGRDGKAGAPGAKGMDGKDGRPGHDLTVVPPGGRY